MELQVTAECFHIYREIDLRSIYYVSRYMQCVVRRRNTDTGNVS